MIRRMYISIGVFIFFFMLRPESTVHAIGTSTVEECQEVVIAEIQEERRAYRTVQFGEEYRSVLGVDTANTTDLVPYLVLNYHALDCRLRMLCDAMEQSHGVLNEGRCSDDPQKSCAVDSDCTAGECLLQLSQPIGCSRLFAARGRWWSPDRRDQIFKTAPMPECAFSVQEETMYPTDLFVANSCRQMIDQVLTEERQMLRLLVAQDSAHRGTRKVVGVFQSVLADVRSSFLVPLIGMVDLFGSLIHPIPCLLSYCQ